MEEGADSVAYADAGIIDYCWIAAIVFPLVYGIDPLERPLYSRARSRGSCGGSAPQPIPFLPRLA